MKSKTSTSPSQRMCENQRKKGKCGLGEAPTREETHVFLESLALLARLSHGEARKASLITSRGSLSIGAEEYRVWSEVDAWRETGERSTTRESSERAGGDGLARMKRETRTSDVAKHQAGDKEEALAGSRSRVEKTDERKET
ncbi:hypothetical protein GSI_07430 [Ganoderma sinense ZZ0214-1]|uniref:Uncharacterized protein n=1 Tax=Ganoderma sinense ZZ0214-1 TaxID=1077348 RepID=A0A2G8S917_9APHY|nr:hypothetical protein GSI_07430 [Ganoderma sinense ZZ0214-1]